MLQPMSTLTTARLRLRPFTQKDLDDYAAMCADAEVMRHIGSGGAVARDIAWRQMALFAGHWSLLGYGMWALQERASGRLVGRAGYLDPEGWPGNELGWLLAREFWGRGVASAALVQFLQHETTRPLTAHVVKHNAASIRVLEKAGFTLAGKEVIDLPGGATPEEFVFTL